MSHPTGNRSLQSLIEAALASEGEGVVIHRAFPTHSTGEIDPFLLFDHLGPIDLAPKEARGFPDHPHRGFETVTYLLNGEFEHRDSFGNHGLLGPGDVQWMTAGSGLVHSETPSRNLYENGGRLQGFQIWVNLPRKDKMKAPHYQEISHDKIPVAQAEGVECRIVAGQALGVQGAVQTHTPIQYLHFTLQAGAEVIQPAPATQNAMLYVIEGTGETLGTQVPRFHMAVFSPDGDAVQFRNPSAEPMQALLLTGEPLHEPVARYGPFVMNTREELQQAFDDYRAGRMGTL